jgi:hypothetical protein
MSNPIAVPGTVVPSGSLTTPGGAQGIQGIQGPTAVSADAGNLATLGSDSLVLVPQSSLWSARLRSFNAISNPTFEVDQRNVGNTVAAIADGVFVQDRWQIRRGGTMVVSAGQNSVAAGINLPGTNFAISRSFLRVTLTTAQASLGASDSLRIAHNAEGSCWRELQNDVHSLQVLVRSSVASLSFGVALRDPTSAHSLTNLVTLGAANTWTLLTLPNLPVWPTGTFVNTPGTVGYLLDITLAAGSTYTSPANSTWQNGVFLGAVGQANFANSPVNSTFDIALVQHEPGSICSTPIDCPFIANLDDCLRYYCKSYPYFTPPGTSSVIAGMQAFTSPLTASSTNAVGPLRFPKVMAKAPTVTLYNDSTGAAGSVRDSTGTAHTCTVGGIGDNGFYALQSINPAITQQWIQFNYAADTGW